MAIFSNLTPARRVSLLAAVMLAVLLLATGAAWLIVRSSPGFGPEADEHWYLIRDAAGELQGWMVTRAGSGGALDRGGYEIISYDSGRTIASRWELNEDATRGQYVSVDAFVMPTGEVRGRQTRILLRDSRATISGGPRRPAATVAVGPEYVAEGTLEDRIVEVARTGRPLIGTIVSDPEMRLIPLILAPVPPGGPTPTDQQDDSPPETAPSETRPADTWPRQVARGGLLPTRRWQYQLIYHVAEDGSIPRIEDLAENGRIIHVTELAEPSAVERLYGDAYRERARLLRQLQFE
jgi:hypothetical protein